MARALLAFMWLSVGIGPRDPTPCPVPALKGDQKGGQMPAPSAMQLKSQAGLFLRELPTTAEQRN